MKSNNLINIANKTFMKEKIIKNSRPANSATDGRNGIFISPFTKERKN